MSYNIDFDIASSEQIATALGKRLESIRLTRNTTQQQLAGEAGVSLRTIGRLERGEGVSLDTLLRVLIALRLQGNVATLLPDPSIRPIDRVKLKGNERRRARPSASDQKPGTWAWGDERDKDE